MRGYGGGFRRQSFAAFSDNEAAQLVELAVILPLLMVIIVGIFDFSQAFNLKQKLANASFQGARLGSSQPTTDLTQPLPLTVMMIRDAIDTNLARASVGDCGLGAITATATPLTWTATGSCAVGTLIVTINRGYTFPATVPEVAGGTVYVVATLVSVSYPYQWLFGRVVHLLVPGSSYGLPADIQATTIVPNQD